MPSDSPDKPKTKGKRFSPRVVQPKKKFEKWYEPFTKLRLPKGSDFPWMKDVVPYSKKKKGK